MNTQTQPVSAVASASIACRICSGTQIVSLAVREMMFGTRHSFEYLECSRCGSVQISKYPDNIKEYYPNDYYSFRADAEQSANASSYEQLKEWLVWQILRGSRRLSERYLDLKEARKVISRNPLLSIYRKYMSEVGSRILDVGCGSGQLLKELRMIHYYHAEGADPFIDHDIVHRGRLLVRKAWLHEIRGTYDCISFHHVLEHMPNQLAVLQTAAALLSRTGIAIIRVPVAGSDAWKRYRQNWVQLDAPRHFYLHTETSLAVLANQAGFDIQEVTYDSTGMQFWGSELYDRDIPLTDPRSPSTEGPSIFSAAELEAFSAKATELNAARRGDQILAVLRPRHR